MATQQEILEFVLRVQQNGDLDKLTAAMAAAKGASDKLGPSVESAGSDLEELAAKYGILEKGIDLFKELAVAVGGLFALDKVKEEIGAVLETGDKFEKWGIQFKNAFGGAEAGQEALARVKEIAENTPYSLDTVTDAALRMRKEGLDPLDGSLQTLIDTNAKYGGSSEQLTSLVDSFGRAMARGQLNTRLLVQLQEEGVPAAKLLGDAMGFTADQINEMAKKGELGRSSIDLLLKQLSASNSGAAAASMSTLSSQVTKLRDQWDEFLKLVADSGLYEFAKSELKEVGEAIQKGLGDGTLKEKAKAISDAIVGIGRAAISVVQFLSDHAQAVKDVAEAYAVLKIGSLAGDILKLGLAAAESAENMVKFGGAAKVAAGATAEVQAAAGAARTNLINMALALAAFDAVKIFEIADGLRETRRVAQEEAASLKEAADAQQSLFQRSITLINQTRDAANTAVLSAEQLKAQSAEQSAAYVEQLQNAVRYYTALRIQAQQFGNADDVRKYTDKLRELAIGLLAASETHAKVAEAVKKTSEAVAGAVASFEKLHQSGASAAEAVQGAFAKLEIHTPEGLREIEDKISGIEAASHGAKDAVESELVVSLEKLNAVDLSDFQRSVERDLSQALVLGKGNAEALKQELQAGLEAELVKVGESAEQAGVKFTQGGQQIITTFRAISENAQATGQQISDAFQHSLAKVTTSGEIQALQAQLKAAFEQGKISASEFAKASEEAALRLKQIAEAASPVEQAMQRLHIVSQTTLQDLAERAKIDFQTVSAASDGSAASIANQQNAFLAYAKARLAASAQLGQAARLQAQTELDAQAGVLGVTGALADLEKQSNASQAATTSDADRAAAALEKEYEQAQRLSGALSGGSGGKSVAQAAGDAQNSVEDMTAQGGSDLAQLDQALAGTRDAFLKVSDAAAKAFDAKLLSDFNSQFDATGIGLGRTIAALNQAAAETAVEIANDRTQLAGMVENVNALGTASNKGFGEFGANAAQAKARIEQMIGSIKDGSYQFGILGQQDLAPLLQALEQAKQRAEAAGQAAAQAAGQFDQLRKSIHDQLLQEQGDQKALEDERHQQVLDNLKKEAAAGQIDQAEYQQAVNEENQLHDLKMKHLQQQQQQQQNNGGGNSGSGGNTSGPVKPNGGSGGGGGGSSSGGAAVPVQALHPINIHIDGAQQKATLYGDGAGAALLEQILRDKNNSI